MDLDHRSLAVWFLLSALLTGCPAVRQETAPPPTAGPPLVWPSPPQRPRIRFVRAVARPADLGIRPTFWERLGELFAGKDETWFIRPTGVAAREAAIYVADPGAQALWILDSQAGRFRRIREAGKEKLVSPVAVAPGRGDLAYLGDTYLSKVFVYDATGNLKATIADRDLRRPAGLAYDPVRDRLYIADSAAHRIWLFTGDGRAVGAIGRRGTGDGEFNFPTQVAVDREGSLYVTDSLGFRIQRFNADGSFAGQFGHPGDSSGDFARPKGIGLDRDGHIYVVESLFDAVQIFDRRGRFLLGFGERGVGPGQFWLPAGLFIDGRDRIYVADAYNQRVQIFEYLPGGDDE